MVKICKKVFIGLVKCFYQRQSYFQSVLTKFSGTVMASSFKSEFQLYKFGFSHDRPDDLQTPMSDFLHPGVLFTLRFSMCAYTITLMVFSIVFDTDGKWIEFLTSWNYLIVVAYFVVAVLVSLVHLRGPRRSSRRNIQVGSSVSSSIGMNDLPSSSSNTNTQVKYSTGARRTSALQKLHWLLFAISFNLSTHATIMYWAALHDYDNNELKANLHTYLLIDRHGINQLLIYIDFILNAIPVRILHFVYPLTIVVIYVIFNASYWKSTGTVLYKILDYGTKPGTAAGVIIGGLILVFVCQFVLHGFYRLKYRFFGPNDEYA